MHRANLISNPYFREQFANKLIKLNHIDYKNWHTETVVGAYNYVKQMEMAEAADRKRTKS